MSSERSGSNLLRRLLAMHSSIAAPPPPHIWRHLSGQLPYYGLLSDADNLKKAATDAISMTQVSGSHLLWKHSISVEELMTHIKTPNLSGIITALYDIYAFRESASAWVCKENNLFDHAFQARAVLPDAKFIYLCRDGRDVACSIKNVPSHDQHIFHIAHEWRNEQQKCILVFQELLAQNGAILVRYEDLISNPLAVTQRICEFVSLPYEPRMIDFHHDQESKEESLKTAYWKNLGQPIIKQNSGKFYEELTKREVFLFQLVAADILQSLGYPLVSEKKTWHVGPLQKLLFSVQNRIYKRIQRTQLRKDPGSVERGKILKKITSRKDKIKMPLAPPITYK
ncbi:sulfotransferase [Gammaproteobacteria bacterium]|nr:sulfotransferase [Gammaproteobacteria bacterium]